MTARTSDPQSVAARDRRDRALEVLRRLRAAGHTAYWVGGCVRDLLMGREPKDYDIATDARPEAVQALFPRHVEIGKSFAVVNVIIGGSPLEVATFREDGEYRDGRRPETIRFAAPEADARRRDFTINGLFYDPENGQVLDYVGGQADIQARLIRAIGDPAARFAEDRLRMLRAIRFATVLDFKIEPATFAAIQAAAAAVQEVSAERIQVELARILVEAPRPGDALRLLQSSNLLDVILPEVAAMAGVEQPPEFHPEGDVFEHTVLMLNAMPPERDVALAFAVLLHDVGKPVTCQMRREPDGRERLCFHTHDKAGARIAEDIMRRLKFSNQDIERVVHGVSHHMKFINVRGMRRATLRRIVGDPAFALDMELHRLDCLASHGSLENYDFLMDFKRQLDNEPVLPAPWLKGEDIMELGVPQGRRVGDWLQVAYEAQLENRFPDRNSLRDWIGAQIRQGVTPPARKPPAAPETESTAE